MKKIVLLALVALAGVAYAGPFVDNNTSLPGLKVDRFAPTDPTRQWTASDANTVINALSDLRTVAKRGWVDVRSFGADGSDGTDDAAAIQAAIVASPGRVIYFPKGRYVVSTTIFITNRMNRFVGDFGGRNINGGSEISFTGTGPCFQIGSDNGHAWSANDYDGPQDQWFENLWISHNSPNTTTDTGANYKAGAQGIWDWRGGGIVLHNVGIEKFETNFVGIQSDINRFYNVTSLYSKYGIYIGPRSDQFTIDGLLSFSCDRAVTVDGAREVRIRGAEFVGCGNASASSVEVRQGSGPVQIEDSWCEHIGATGYTGTDGQSCYSIGEVAGYGTGGSISSPGGSPNTNTTESVAITDGTYYITATGQPGHLKWMASVGKAARFQFRHPGAPPGIGGPLGIDAFVGVQAATSPNSTDTQISIRGILSGDLSKALQVLGGTPGYDIQASGTSGTVIGASTADSHTINGALTISPPSANPAVTVLNSTTGSTLSAAIALQAKQNGTYNTAGFTQSFALQGNSASTQSGAGTLKNIGGTFTATAGGQNEALETISGDVNLNVSSGTAGFQRSVRFINELVVSGLSSNQDNYNPTGLSDAAVLVLSSTGAINITGFDSASSAGGVFSGAGRVLYVYNNGANNITLKHQTTSTSARQIVGRGGADTVLTPNTGAMLYYSPSVTKWLILEDSL